ncbi:amidohydrolase family protein [Niabella sp. W65]|nr:amidohydrolase family protein [Niabella sp. W65]MCH7361322.1 amidohydrolase family protein [Niabella sp. W65]
MVDKGVAWLPDRTSFAGSVATADRLVRNMIHLAEVPLTDAIKMISMTPARIMGIDGQKGSIAVGKDADLVLFDQDIQVRKTIVKGKVIYSSDNS